MRPSTDSPDLTRTRLRSLLSTSSPLRYGVAIVILLTVGYAWFRVVPMVRGGAIILRDVYAVDQKGISLESDLQYEIQESRRRFLRVLLAAGKPQEAKQEIQAMQEFDVQVAQTEAQIAQLKGLPEASQTQFHVSWLQYIVLRNRMLEIALKGNPEAARQVDQDLGQGSFMAVVKAVRSAEAAFEVSSDDQIRSVTQTLNKAVREVMLLVGLKIAVLMLLLWMDWKRVHVEKQLELTTHELRASEDRFEQAYDSAAVGMGIVRMDGSIRSANRKAAEILGYDRDKLLGMKVRDLVAPEFREDHLRQLAILESGEDNSYQTERRFIRQDGRTVWLRNSVTMLRPENDEAHCFFTCEEITLEKEANDRLAYLANYDPVTNLPNRRFFEEQLAAELHPAAGRSDALALLYLEIDSFDFLKGTFGRTFADEILSELGADLAAFRREGEIIGRLDDNVFGMLVKAAPYDEATMVRGGELRDVFRRAGESGRHRIPLSASIGIAYASDLASDMKGNGTAISWKDEPASMLVSVPSDSWLMTYARAAMMEARSRGGDSIYIADPGLQEQATQRHRIESALLRGLREDEFRVVFQPQFELQTGNLVRFEALCRWNSAELGPIPPDRFIPIAEQTGLIIEIGRRVLFDALRQAKTWIQAGRRVGVAVNISPMQFMRPDFTQTVTEALAATQFPPALLELEITEGVFIRDLNLAVARIRELQRLGLSIALDDFGTGYSSLSYLQRMPIDAVKLDRSFVSDLTSDLATVSMVRSVLAMASALNLRVVTEGVETEQQLEILRSMGCDEAQGYLLGRPETAEMAMHRVLESPVNTVRTVA